MTPSTPKGMMSAVAGSMQDRTGKTVQEWVDLVALAGIDLLDQRAVRRWLKAEHGILQNSQWSIADAAARRAGWKPPSTEEQIALQYAGAKAHLRPVFDAVRELAETLGSDSKMGGRSTYIPFIRRRQFMAVAASTRTRVDIGLRYVDAPESALLTQAQAPGQATHKLSLTTPDQLSAEVCALIRVAYEQNG